MQLAREPHMLIHKTIKVTNQHAQLLLLADPSQTAIDRYLSRSILFDYRNNDCLLGVMALLPTRPQTIEIINLAVAEHAQRQGIGEKLVRFALQYAKENNYTIVEVGTGTTSFGPLSLYQKCGFRIIAIESDYFLTHYTEPIIENGLVLKDLLRLRQTFLQA